MLQLTPLSAARALCAGVLLLGLTAWSSPAEAQKARILHSTRGAESAWVEYVKKVINDTGLYPDGIDDSDVAYTDPPLMELLNYKLIVVMGSDFGLNSGPGTGDPLGDYMAMVPGASVLIFYPYIWQTGLFAAPPIGGKFAANYSLTTPVATSTNTAAKLGMTTANDPLVNGLMAFNCGSACQRLTGLMPRPGATVSALWDDGNILAIRGRNRVDLNMMPADTNVITGTYDAAAVKLITNAIVYLSSPLTATPGQAAFPATPLGSTSQAIKVTLKNGSRNALSVTGIGLDGADKAQFSYKSLQSPTFAVPLVLAPGNSFTVDVSYRPQKQGTHAGLLYVTSVGFGRTEVTLTGSSKGNLFVSGSPIDFGGIPAGATKGPVMVTLTNAGAVDITLKKPVIGDAMHYTFVPFVPFDTVKLAPGATYRFTVEFKPGMAAGEFPTNVTVESDDPSSPLLIPVRGLAGPPKLDVAYMALLMPDVPFGQKGLPLEVLLTNTGNSILTVSDIVASNMDFEVTMPAKPLKIEARESAVVQLVFAPKAAGLRTGKVTVKSDEPPAMGMPNSDKVIDLAGTATVPKFRVSATSVDFGTTDIGKDPGPKTITIYNDGDGVLKVTSLDVLAGPSSESFRVLTAAPAPFGIPPFGSVDAQVSLQPKSAGMLAATLRVVTDLMMMGTAQVDLKAEVNGAVAQLSPKTLEFGSQKVKSSAKKSFTFKNVGNKDLTIRALKLNAPPMAAGVFSVQSVVNAVVAAGGMKDIEVTFSPMAAAAYMATIDIDTDDPATTGGTQFQLAVNGVGVIGNVSIMPLILDFTPAIYVGQTSGMQSITVRNAGDVTIDNLGVRVSGPDAGEFMRVGMSKTKLMPGESTEIAFVFAPKVAKAQETATVVVDADNVAAMMMVQLKGSSLSPLLRVQPDSLKLDDTEIEARSMPKYVTIVNDGPQKLEIEVGAPSSEDFEVDTSGTEATLAPGDTTRFAVLFAPKATGSKSETIEIKLKGSAVVAGTVSIEGEALKKKPAMEGGGCAVSGEGGMTAAPLGMLLLCGVVLLRRRRRA